jgi:TM2 domain-containing membrane protein YozV
VSDSAPTVYRPLGAILGWLFPGLGQIAAGNARRGVVAMAGVLTLFVSGLLVGGVDCVDYREDRLWFYGQAGCGPIAFAAGFANESLLKSGSAAPMVEMPAPPGAPKVTASVFKGLAHANEFGTLLVFLAGLMNVCVLLDAVVREPSSDAATGGRRATDARGGAA